MKLWFLRQLFQAHPPREALNRRDQLATLVRVTMRNREGSGGAWPPGTAEAIADLMLPHPDRIAIRIAEREIPSRDVGGRNTFIHGAGI